MRAHGHSGQLSRTASVDPRFVVCLLPLTASAKRSRVSPKKVAIRFQPSLPGCPFVAYLSNASESQGHPKSKLGPSDPADRDYSSLIDAMVWVRLMETVGSEWRQMLAVSWEWEGIEKNMRGNAVLTVRQVNITSTGSVRVLVREEGPGVRLQIGLRFTLRSCFFISAMGRLAKDIGHSDSIKLLTVLDEVSGDIDEHCRWIIVVKSGSVGCHMAAWLTGFRSRVEGSTDSQVACLGLRERHVGVCWQALGVASCAGPAASSPEPEQAGGRAFLIAANLPSSIRNTAAVTNGALSVARTKTHSLAIDMCGGLLVTGLLPPKHLKMEVRKKDVSPGGDKEEER
ncbi:hypothetical protein Bbelb_435180 [Branchiostoma belcheri]|nr:hypothetical protein Bbelb_435180 [Branchiostoma belcheri]